MVKLEQLDSLIKQLSNEEYLQFMINNYFNNYLDDQLFLSVFNTKRNILMSTKLNEQTYGYSVKELHNIPYENFPHLQGHKHIVKFITESMDYVIQHKSQVLLIIFDKYKDLLGAMHLKMDPILTPNNQVCGICNTHYDFTKLFFGVNPINLNNKGKIQANLSECNLQRFTERQKHVLFLLALNMTQDIIAETLETTRGTIARIIAQICDKFSLSPSAKNLIEYLGRTQIIEQLTLPHAVVKPHLIRIIPHKKLINK